MISCPSYSVGATSIAAKKEVGDQPPLSTSSLPATSSRSTDGRPGAAQRSQLDVVLDVVPARGLVLAKQRAAAVDQAFAKKKGPVQLDVSHPGQAKSGSSGARSGRH